MDKAGKSINRIKVSKGYPNIFWGPNKKLGVINRPHLGLGVLIDLDTFEETEFELPPYTSIMGWHPNSRELTLSNHTGLYLFDIEEREVSFSYEEDCNNQGFVNFFISEDGRYGYSRRHIVDFISNYQLSYDSKVIWIDFETGEEYEVDLRI